MVAVAFSAGVSLAEELDVARAALQDRLYPVAQRHAQRALEEAPGNHAALAVLLEALCAQGQAQDALDALDRHAGAQRDAPSPALFTYWRAVALLKAGRAAEAARVASSVPVPDDHSIADSLLRVAARARRAEGDLPGALELFAEVDRRTADAATRAANALEWASALDEAVQEHTALSVLAAQAELDVQSPEMDEGALLHARILMRQGKAADALARFAQLAAAAQVSEGVRAQALGEMGVHALALARTNEAVAHARAAYDLAQQPAVRRLAGFRLGDLLCLDGETLEEGEALVKRLVREFPDEPVSLQAHLRLADALLRFNRASQAAEEYRIFLETHPSSSLDEHVLLGRGWALFQLARYAEAGAVFRRVAEQTTNLPMRAECLYKQGDALAADARYAEAAQAYAQLAEDHPDAALAPRALYQSAESLERTGQLPLALTRYRQAAEAYPASEVAPRALLRLAALHLAAGDADAALRTYTAVQTNAAHRAFRSDALMGRGKAHYRLYRFDTAMQDFAAVAEGDTARRDEARFAITDCLYKLGRDADAHAAATAFILDFPESRFQPDMMLWLGKFEFNRKRFAEARKFFVEYVTRWAKAEWADAALLWAAQAATNDADFTGAVELVTRLVQEYPKSARLIEARLTQVEALMELARFPEAVLLLDQIITGEPDGEWAGEAKLRKGDCLLALGADNSAHYVKALAAYRDVLEQPSLTPSQRLQLHYKAGRCLEKLQRIEEAIDTYYAEVIVRYLNDRAAGVWYDDAATGRFMQATFNVASLCEQRGKPDLAVNVLGRVLQSDVSGKDEIRQRMERLRKKK
ncbi:MAG: tetratricopeptide repeat protein [Kiritimatiellaeota bacterium]|nr:tetratricopeptide repeat protein [Kiritimatiellota bacterium]